MHDEPPASLTDLLARLHLAKPEQVRAVRHLARGLARDLPLFESVWVDALVQASLLTPYQAAEINAGRGEQLRAGPYVARNACGVRFGWAECLVAVHQQSKRTVHLLVHRKPATESGTRQFECAVAELQTVAQKFRALQGVKSPAPSPPVPQSSPPASRVKAKRTKILPRKTKLRPFVIPPLVAAGAEAHTLWAAMAPSNGMPASQWLSWHGRLPAALVLEIARQMVAALAEIEVAGITHGDIAATSLMLNEKGEVQLARCGVRAIYRPDERENVERLPIEAFDYLDPQRIERTSSQATRLNAASDLYACGCLWWQLLTGLTPMAGGNHAEKLRAIEAGKTPELARLTSDMPKPLAEAINQCIRCEPEKRPVSFAELARQLGPSTSAGRRRLSDLLIRSGRRTMQVDWAQRVRVNMQRSGTQMMAVAACALLLAAATWPIWRTRHTTADRSNTARTALASAAQASAKITKVVAHASIDPALRQVNYQAAETAARESAATLPSPKTESPGESQPNAETARPVIELAEEETAGAKLRLQPGTIVRAKEGKRARIVTPPNGLAVAVDNVRFENVDFIWRQRPEAITSPDRHSLIDVRGARTEFVGCTFQAVAAGSFELPAAVRLNDKAQRVALAPAGQVRFERCALSGVACGIDCALAGPAAIEIANTLHTGRGALVRFSQPRRGDAPAAITLQHVTLRGATAAVEIHSSAAVEEIAPLTITAAGCVFAPDKGGALLVFDGPQVKNTTGEKLRGIDWLGEGSLMAAGSPVAIWRHEEASQTLAEDELSIDGLVASPVEFIAPTSNDPAASRLKKWAAPLQSEQTPGIGNDLPKLPAIEKR